MKRRMTGVLAALLLAVTAGCAASLHTGEVETSLILGGPVQSGANQELVPVGTPVAFVASALPGFRWAGGVNGEQLVRWTGDAACLLIDETGRVIGKLIAGN